MADDLVGGAAGLLAQDFHAEQQAGVLSQQAVVVGSQVLDITRWVTASAALRRAGQGSVTGLAELGVG